MGLVHTAALMSILACGVSCALLVPRFASWAHAFVVRTTVRTRMRESARSWADADGVRPGGIRSFVRAAVAVCFESGVAPARFVSSRLLKVRPIAAEVGRIVELARGKGVQAVPESTCQTLLFGGALFAGCVALLIGSVVSGLLALALGIALTHMRVARGLAEISDEMRRLVPDAMRALGVYYSSGLTLVQSFEHAASEVPAPLGPRLAEVVVGMKAGMSAADALERLRSDDDRALAFVSIALEVQHLTGAPMQPLLDGVADSVEAAQRLRRSLEVQTAQARLSAKIVSVMPLCIVALMGIVNPSYLASFLGSPLGLAMFIVACMLELLGILAIRKILDVEVA